MLLKMAQLAAIRRGEVSVVLRRWKRPTVKAGGTLNTAVGQLAIDEVATLESVTEADAAAAGYASAEAARADLAGEGTLYQIRVRFLGVDPRVALREDTDLEGVLDKLGRLDVRGAWTGRVLDLIAEHPGRRAGDLAALSGLETAAFKQNVRKLKALGLTESLEVGYRLSPRGQAVRAALR